MQMRFRLLETVADEHPPHELRTQPTACAADRRDAIDIAVMFSLQNRVVTLVDYTDVSNPEPEAVFQKGIGTPI